jgi:hypothetical protein
MKSVLLVLFSSFLLLGNSSFNSNTAPVEILPCKPEATCYGNSPCHACTNCNYCKYCNSGGTCGVCASSKKKTYTRIVSSPYANSQCRAITKKAPVAKDQQDPMATAGNTEADKILMAVTSIIDPKSV